MKRSIHHRSPAIEKSGFQHYRKGCLCQRCEHYFSCRMTSKIISSRLDTANDKDSSNWIPVSPGMTPAMLSILDQLKCHAAGLTVRELAAKTGYSARHIYRCVKILVSSGKIQKYWDLRREYIIDTMLRHYETTELAHRYVIPGDNKK